MLHANFVLQKRSYCLSKFCIVEISIFNLFCSCNLDLDPTTFMYKPDMYSMEIYRMCKYELPTSRLLKVTIWHTYTHTASTWDIFGQAPWEFEKKKVEALQTVSTVSFAHCANTQTHWVICTLCQHTDTLCHLHTVPTHSHTMSALCHSHTVPTHTHTLRQHCVICTLCQHTHTHYVSTVSFAHCVSTQTHYDDQSIVNTHGPECNFYLP